MPDIQTITARKTGLIVVIIALFSFAFLFCFPAHPTYAQASGIQDSNKPLQSLHSFVGQWYTHAGVLTVKDDGTATFIARAYVKCGANVKAPCDTWDGNLIIPGIKEDIVIHDANKTVAHGIITTSTDGQKGKSVTMTLQPQDTLQFNEWTLCGLKAPVGYCGA